MRIESGRWLLLIGSLAAAVCWSLCHAANPGASPAAVDDPVNLVKNSDFSERAADGRQPADYQLDGDVEYRYVGDAAREVAGWGVAFQSGKDLNGDGAIAGSVAQSVTGIDSSRGRWFRFAFRGLAQNHFAVAGDDLFMKVEFFGSKNGHRAEYDGKVKKIYSQVERDRCDLSVNSDRQVGGAAVWRTYQLDFRIPFSEVDEIRVSAGFGHGSARQARDSEFYVTDFRLQRLEGIADEDETATTRSQSAKPDNLVHIGGRWFYAALSGETAAPKLFDRSNADRLIYHDDQWGAPFAGNTTAWLRAGDLDSDGNLVQQDRFVADNVTISFDATSMIVHTQGLPNHPTGKFPMSGFGPASNPNYIQQRRATYYIPLDPQPNPNHVAIRLDDSNHALHGGPIGVAQNGIVFFNPFDADSKDATNMMDFCCGHPSPDNQYHYHKYPICINSPWADDGKEHSPVIGWAFDGFPIYGPYVSAGVMAKDATGDAGLNEFNIHWDPDRGWHYQVTPGKFPYVIGGFWGSEDSRDSIRGRGPRGGGRRGPPGGAPPSGPPPPLPPDR
jgi:hypothetical protein